MNRIRRRMVALLSVLVALGLSAAIVEYAPAPLVWVALVWIIVLVTAAVRTRSSLGRATWINLAAAFLAIGASEAYLWLNEEREPREDFKGAYAEGYFVADDVLGY